MRNPSVNNPNPSTGSNQVSTHTCDLRNGQQRSCCSKTCTAVNRDCDWFFTGDCKCYAPACRLVFLARRALRVCSPLIHARPCPTAMQLLPERSGPTHFLQWRHRPCSPPPDPTAQIASGLLSSPCNFSHISSACADSTKGIIYEPPQNWLGALLPEGANPVKFHCQCRRGG